MSDSSAAHDGPLWTEGGSPTKARAWLIACWAIGAAGFVFIASVPDDGTGEAWPLLVGGALMGAAYFAFSRSRKQERRPRIVEPALLRVRSRRGLPGQPRRRGLLALDERAVLFEGELPAGHWVARYRDAASARLLRVGTEGKEHDYVEVTLRDGTRTAFTAPDVGVVLELLGAKGVDVLEREALERAPRMHRSWKRIWIVTGVAVLGVVLAFVVLGAVVDSHDPNQPASDDEVHAVATRAEHDMDGWELPAAIARSKTADRARAYGYGGIEVVREFELAAGVDPQAAIDAFAATLREQGYTFEQEADGSWQGDGNCRLPDYPECVLAIELAAPERDRVEVTFLP